MKKQGFLAVFVSLLGISTFCSTVYAATLTATPRAADTNVLQPSKATVKPPQPLANQAASVPVCANHCENGMMIEQKLVSGVCKRTSVRSCFPYKCTYQGTLCHSSCTGNAQCATGAYCNQSTGQCVSGNNCPSKCEGDNKVDYLPSSMLPGSNTCKRDKTTSCFPYSCDPQTGRCRYNCTADGQCAVGAMCNTAAKSCVPATDRCDKVNTNILILADGTKVNCDPYICKGNACMSTCDSSYECIKGYVCDTMYRYCIKNQ